MVKSLLKKHPGAPHYKDPVFGKPYPAGNGRSPRLFSRLPGPTLAKAVNEPSQGWEMLMDGFPLSYPVDVHLQGIDRIHCRNEKGFLFRPAKSNIGGPFLGYRDMLYLFPVLVYDSNPVAG